jgi:hypothetical protein
LKPDVLKPDVLKPDVLWVYRIFTCKPVLLACFSLSIATLIVKHSFVLSGLSRHVGRRGRGRSRRREGRGGVESPSPPSPPPPPAPPWLRRRASVGPGDSHLSPTGRFPSLLGYRLIRIRGSVPLINGSKSGSGSCYFCP